MTKYIEQNAALALIALAYDMSTLDTDRMLCDSLFHMVLAEPAADVVPGEDFRDCRNELCLKCGSYQYDYKTHECDGCRWRH